MSDASPPFEPKVFSFRIGDVFLPDDGLALWFCTIALAFNDIVLAHVRADEAPTEWERFYFSRVGFGHYNEILLFLEREDEKPEVQQFITTLPVGLQTAYREALAIYDANRSIANRLRNEAIFHYPDSRGISAMQNALREQELQDSLGGVASATGKVRDTRLHYADEVMAMMVMKAGGGTVESFGDVLDALRDGVQVFMRWANEVQPVFFEGKVRFHDPVREPTGSAAHRAAALHNVGFERGSGGEIWLRGVQDALALHESAREAHVSNTSDREAWDRMHSSAYMVVVAIDQVLRFARRVLKLTGDAELGKAIRHADQSCRDVARLRDVIVHLDDYAVGEGDRQSGKRSPRLEDRYPSPFIFWGNGGGTIVDVADSRIELRTAASDVAVLSQVVERIRARWLERFEREANDELRRTRGLPPE